MKAWKRIFACAVLAALLIFFGVNLALVRANVPQSGRPYRVEINRLALVIEEKGIQGADLSECEYVYNIAEYGENFYGAENDYIIKEIDGRLYRFDYSAKKGTDNMPVTVIVNIALGVMTAAVFAFLIYVGEKILRPFERLTSCPRAILRCRSRKARAGFSANFCGESICCAKISRSKSKGSWSCKGKRRLFCCHCPTI